MEVVVHQTHISVVFLVGPFAYKIKKPVNLGFLDFRTVEKRRHFCEEEVRLNRRLAPTVYHGVVPVTRAGSAIRMEGTGQVVDWAVKMACLPEDATLGEAVRRNAVGAEFMQSLARRIAQFHASAEAGPHIDAFGRFEVVAANARENFAQSAPLVGTTVHPTVVERLKALTEASLFRLRPLIESRAEYGVPRDTHGDLHLDHVYLFPERQPPDDLVIIDCIEFNERFRYADPVADAAFLAMDLAFHGRRDLARTFAEAYFRESADERGRELLSFYTAYRAVVRAKVEGFELSQKEIPEAERDSAMVRARAHWLLALGELEDPRWKPCLVLVGGLPGTGKSTVARGLAQRAGFTVIRSDVVRKELAGVLANGRAAAPFGGGIYSSEWTERTYGECLRRAEQLLFEGERVVIDATFGEEKMRQAFLEAVNRWAVPALFLVCQADREAVRNRLASRKGDASDADWEIYQKAAERWEEPSPATREAVYKVDTAGSPEETLARAVEILQSLSLAETI
jgi:aminoglycoside phosphotransferase family enzyme/predicted kinase